MGVYKEIPVELIKYPLLTEKTIKLVEQNQYSFIVDRYVSKLTVKYLVEALFDVKVIAVNTSLQAVKRRRVGKFIGKKPLYKRAIVTLAPEDSITLFDDI
jgi:large subunit ribosomal protein L23